MRSLLVWVALATSSAAWGSSPVVLPQTDEQPVALAKPRCARPFPVGPSV